MGKPALPDGLNGALEHLNEGRPAEALDRAYGVLENVPDNADAMHVAGMALNVLGRRAEAVRIYETAHGLYPTAEGIACNFAALLRDTGAMARAATVYRTLLDGVPESAEAILGLSLCAAPEDGGPPDARLAGLLDGDGLSPERRIALLFARANRHHWSGDVDAAFQGYQEANAALRVMAGRYDLNAYAHVVDMLIRDLNAGVFAATGDWGSDSEVPVFVAGLPRSGKTTLERIVTDHAAVHGAGELTLLQRTAADIEQKMSDDGGSRRLHRGTISFRAQGFLAELRRRAPNATRILETNPNNLILLGFAALMFPKAPIIFCLRDALDTGLSCYATRFVGTQSYSTDLADTGRFIAHGRRLWDHWRRVLPNPILEVDARDLMGDPGRTAKRVHAFLGLTPPLPRPPSEDAGQGLVFHARDYAAHLAPLREGLAVPG